jgi:hypothetical protein
MRRQLLVGIANRCNAYGVNGNFDIEYQGAVAEPTLGFGV